MIDVTQKLKLLISPIYNFGKKKGKTIYITNSNESDSYCAKLIGNIVD